MSAFYDLNKTPRNILNQAIVRAIVSENNGALFDPSDMSTLYQDAAGTIPVTAVEQPVGLMLDKSGNGYHATQSITASRPTLSARYNLLTKTEDFSDAVWIKVGSMITNAGVFKGSTFFRIENSGASYTQAYLRVTTNKIGSTIYVNSFYVKKGNTDFVFIRDLSTKNTPAYFNLDTGLFETVGDGLTANATTLPDGWYLLEVSVTTPSSVATNILDIGPATLNNDDRKSNPGSYVYVCKPSVCVGPKYTPYQRVNTATDYDTDERYFPKYLRFDGVDDYLVLPYMGLYANGSASVVAAYDLHPLLYHEYLIAERSASETNSAYMLQRKNFSTNKLGNLIRNSAGVALADDNSINLITLPVAVISTVDSGSAFSTYINSTIGGSVAYVRSGVVATTNTVIGASVSTTTGNQSKMNLYGLIITKSALTDSQCIACERYLGRKSGVQL